MTNLSAAAIGSVATLLALSCVLYFNKPACWSANIRDEGLDTRVRSTVYIDVGANRGDTLKSFYKQKKVDGSNNPLVKLPYTYDPANWKVFAFEADAIHTQELQKLQKQYNFQLYTETAAGIDNNGVQLFLDRAAEKNGYWGTSIVETKNDVTKTNAVQIPSIDFSKWLQNHVTHDDFVVLKMNIEGAEFAILDKMIQDDTFCLIDQLFIFYHANIAFQGENSLANSMPERVKQKSVEPFCKVQILLQSEH
ncbi:uncharacterized protein LOC102810286 [Saccoglossus kowalevskii]|uniref:Uncharacterized protein LOC102810286 n=1 Tax=Saccoglossus kowalevskii TaxID=10224 RepID=A0ABM0MSV5_SACKO|nr:PREDICTED: uncharacterized protein LOC102810286 [Saccoglossus kowalevskii]